MSFDLVLFGGTGDLTWRKLMPALFQAFKHGTLPQGARIIGVGRDDLSDEQYRELIHGRFAPGGSGQAPDARRICPLFASCLSLSAWTSPSRGVTVYLRDKLAQRRSTPW